MKETMAMRAPLLERLEELLDRGGTKKDVALLAVSAVALGFSFFAPETLPFNPAWIAIVLCGAPIILGAVIGLVTEFDIKADVLVSLALIAAVAIGEDFAAGEVALIMQLGALLEDLTVAKARAGIERLVHLSPRTARIVRDGVETVVAAEDVQVGDVLRVLPGETVAVDGTVLEGRTSIDESVMTGESLPVDKAPGDEVKSGTVNQFGAFDMRAQRVGEDSSLARMIELVQSADAGKAKIVRLADRWATWIVVIALTAAAGTWLVTGEIIRAVTILVVFCPCALVLATPTAIMAAIGNVTKLGVLVREGDALERLAKVRKVAFDKTGTLTYGRPEVVAVGTIEGSKVDEEQLYSLVASAESMSEHPLGKAVVRGWEQRAAAAPGEAATAEASAAADAASAAPALARPSSFDMVPGRGVRASVAGRDVAAGNREMLAELGVDGADALQAAALPFAEQGCTVVLAALDGQAAGFIALADTVRPTAEAAVRGIRTLGVEPVLLTGDHAQAARHIAAQAGIVEVEADCLPQNKLAAVERLEREGAPVCMVGDGINDAPALARADVGIAIGAGTDVAISSADVVLMKSDLMDAVDAIRLSRQTMRNIRQNLFWAFFYNCIGIPIAAGVLWLPLGLKLSPMIGAAAMSLSSVCVVSNALRLKFFQSTPKPASKPGEYFVLPKEEAKMTKVIKVEGMMCEHCVAHVKKALETFPGVSVAVDLASGKATVQGDNLPDNAKLAEAVEQAGYKVVGIE